MNISSRLQKITLLVMDVDGVLTDGTIYFSDSGEVTKGFNALDGAGLAFLHRAGLASAIISGRADRAVEHRAAGLGIAHVHLGVEDKLTELNNLLTRLVLPPEQAAFIGDDLPDLPAMRICGAAFAPPDAAAEVLAAADIRLTRPGGRGAVREAIEMILKARGLWDVIVSAHS